MNKELTKIKQELLEGRSIITFTSGISMEPLLHDRSKRNATHVLIVPEKRICQIGDMSLVLMEDGKYVLHRIVRIDNQDGKIFYQTRGDNCIGSEYVPQEAVLGIVTEIYYKHKTVKITDKSYKCYVRVWMKIYPLRKFGMKCRVKCTKWLRTFILYVEKIIKQRSTMVV